MQKRLWVVPLLALLTIVVITNPPQTPTDVPAQAHAQNQDKAVPQPTTPVPLNTELADFFQPGSQPQSMVDPLISSDGCGFCHGGYDPDHEIELFWKTSIMAQAARDPLFHAGLAIAEQDAPFSGDFCMRCHTPNGWMGGRSQPTDGSALSGSHGDFDGVSCHFCHRLVDPILAANAPPSDAGILANLTSPPDEAHNGQYVLDPLDRRRGPFQLAPNFLWHSFETSPFHQESRLCGTCHDVSNPVFVRVGDSYLPTPMGMPHPTHEAADQFPLDRTYSEWSRSEFATVGVDVGDRFGGNLSVVSSCQDCHMPDVTAHGCGLSGPLRNDMPKHEFAGSHTWILDAILNLDISGELYDTPSYLTVAQVEDAKERNIDMLQRAADLELLRTGPDLRVRIVNQTGHKLPTGYAEGRRMWAHVQFQDYAGAIVGEYGSYDFATAVLDTESTRVYEAKLGLDATMAALTGRPAGESFHFTLNNKIYKDNRIPPRGFTNVGFAEIQASPVGHAYADGQHWDDTLYTIPTSARFVTVRLYYQTASKEYIEFLRDENVTNDAGQILYDQWLSTGKGAPVLMGEESLELTPAPFIRGDCNGNGSLELGDLFHLLQTLFLHGDPLLCEAACDSNADTRIDIADVIAPLDTLYQGGPPLPAPFPSCDSPAETSPLACVSGGCP